MKQLLNGVAIAAVLAIAAPVLAQTNAPMTPAAPRAPAAAPAAAPMAPMATKQRHKRMVRHAKVKRGMARKAAPDSMANQLNRDELSRIQSGGSMPGPGGAAPGMAPPPGQGGPRPSGR